MSDNLVTSLQRISTLRSLPDYQWKKWVLEAANRIEADQELIQEMREALDRQCDNMAFIINHVGIPNAWLEKFMRELEEDRKPLSKAKSQQEGETE